MYSHINITEMKKAVAIFLALVPFVLLAQTANDAVPVAANGTGQMDTIWYIILGTMTVLLFAILVLGSVLVNLVKVVIEKSKARSATLILLLLISGSLFAQNPTPSLSAGGSTLAADWTMIMAGCVLLAELFVIIVLLLRIRLIIIELSDKKKSAPVAIELHMPKLFDNINASVPVENEQDILLNHDYDGIRELNNNLPPWWKYSFYLSIIFAVCYLSYYHVLGGPSSKDEYDASMRQAQQEQEEYNRLNAGKVDENALKMADAGGIAEGKDIFIANCAACHGQLGEGMVGPNLTDNYWLHGGSLTDVYKTIKNGYPAKGMKSWATDLSPVQIKNVASYVKTLGGTTPPNAKAPQGDLYQPYGDKQMQSSGDTTKAKSI